MQLEEVPRHCWSVAALPCKNLRHLFTIVSRVSESRPCYFGNVFCQYFHPNFTIFKDSYIPDH